MTGQMTCGRKSNRVNMLLLYTQDCQTLTIIALCNDATVKVKVKIKIEISESVRH